MSVIGVIRHARGVGTQMSVQRHKVANACTINLWSIKQCTAQRDNAFTHEHSHMHTLHSHCTTQNDIQSFGMGWDGMGWDGMGWDGMGWNVEKHAKTQ